jgi:hypothetical protein
MKRFFLFFSFLWASYTLEAQIKIDDYTRELVKRSNTPPSKSVSSLKPESSTASFSSDIVTDTPPGVFFSEPTINRIFAKRMAQYLSGSNDLSFYRNFATINSKGFSIGNTFAFPSDPYSNIKKILNTSIKIPLLNDQAVIFQSDKVQKGIVASFKLALFGNGNVFYANKEDVRYMNGVREFLSKTIDRKVYEDRSTFNKIYDNTGNESLSNEKKTGFEKGLSKKYREEFAEEEESYGMKKVNSLTKNWFLISGDAPISAIEYTVAESNKPMAKTIPFNPFVLGFQFGKFTEKKDIGWVFTLDAKVRHDNLLRFYNDYKGNIRKDSLGAFGRIFGINKISGDTTFINNTFHKIGSFSITPRLYCSLPEAKFQLANGTILFNSVAFNAFTQSTFIKHFVYHNLNLGVVFSMAGRDGKPVNVEFLGTFVDVFNGLAPREFKSSRFTLSASVAIPLNSVVF